MNRRIGILGGLAALLPLAVEGKKHHAKPRKKALAAQSLCGCPLTFASYSADFTPGGEDVSVVTATSGLVTITLPAAASSAGQQVMIVRAQGASAKLAIYDGATYLVQTPGLFVCDGTAWYVAANF